MNCRSLKMKGTLSLVSMLIALLGATLGAQVVTPMEVPDLKAQGLQQRHLQDLMAIASEIEAHKFPYPFYFSEILDLDLKKMHAADQRSIRFDFYKGQTVLEVTGNYYASYSSELMGPYARLKETFLQVVMPILRAEVPRFPDDSEFSAFAIEVSHHVRQKALSISSERPENVTVIIPVPVAQKLVDAKTDEQRQAAVLEGSVFLNAEPYALWLQEGAPSDEWNERTSSARNAPLPSSNTSVTSREHIAPTVSATLLQDTSPIRILTAESLAKLQQEGQSVITQITTELDAQAHFLKYVSPSFVGFRQRAYLQLSLETRLSATSETSRYKLAALAFDEHVSHLVRSVLTYFPKEADFDGISFSSTIRLADGPSPVAVEFFFPFRVMRCFAAYDCTGQQLIESGTVVINGERAALDLQAAESRN
jgi:hypothetical protein